jgi:hypothetical protein
MRASARNRRPSPSLMLAILAIILALAGTAIAGVELGRNSVGTPQLRDNAVTAPKLANGAVRCASDTFAVGPACVEVALRAPRGHRAAVKACAGSHRRLPFITELEALAARGMELGNPELVADVRPNSTEVEQVVLYEDARVAGVEAYGTQRRFRCVGAPQ